MEKDTKTVTHEEAILMQAYQFEALLRVLEKKELITKNEVLTELKIIIAEKGGTV